MQQPLADRLQPFVRMPTVVLRLVKTTQITSYRNKAHDFDLDEIEC